MDQKIKLNLEKVNIKNDQTVLLAVSGGPDSMAMLHSIYKISKEIGFKIVVAHVNHGVRGEFALRDQEFVEKISRKLDIPYFTKNVDMISYGKENGISSEEAGRILRYGFFREVLNSVGGGLICVAHNKNDQAETVLLRILRGTGIEGLKAMELISGDIIRPLLNIERKDIEKYIDDNNIETMQDHTNLQTVYSRNRVRLQLIPYLEENFNPNIIDALFRLSEIASWENEILDDIVEKKFNLIVKKISTNSIIFKGNDFLKESDALKRKLIRFGILKVQGHLQGIQEVNVSSVLDLYNNGNTGKTIDLPNGLKASVSYDEFKIGFIKEESTSNFIFNLKMGINKVVEIKKIIDLSIVTSDQVDYSNNSIKFFDYQNIRGEMILRFRKDGDRFIPFGSKGSKKLKDYFIDKKVPRETRDLIPLIVDEEKVLWIVGYTKDDRVRIDNNSKILRIEVRDI